MTDQLVELDGLGERQVAPDLHRGAIDSNAARQVLLIAMGIAGLVNMSMLIIAASLFHGNPQFGDTESIEDAYKGFEILVGFLQAYIFTLLTAVYIADSLHAEH